MCGSLFFALLSNFAAYLVIGARALYGVLPIGDVLLYAGSVTRFNLHLLDGFCAGSHVIAEVMVYFVCPFHQLKIYERIFRLFCDFFNIRHK